MEHYAPPWEHGFETCFSTEAKVPTFDPLITPPREHGGVGANLTPGEPFGTAYWTGPGQQVTEDLRGDDSTLIMDRALEFVTDSANKERPFFAVVWLHAPHLPILASEARAQRFADRPLKERHYLASLEAVDDNIGKLRRHLRELGLGDDTLVWFTSDNGPESGPDSGLGSTGPFSGRKRSLKEGGVRVPGLLEWPARFAPARIEAAAGTLDILPTVLAALDLPGSDARLDGIDLGPLLRGERRHREQPMGFLYRGAQAWSEGSWKIHRTSDQPFALCHLDQDPGETNDLAGRHPQRVSELREDLEAWVASLPNGDSP